MFDRLADEPGLALRFGFVEPAIVRAGHYGACGAQADERRDVERDTAACDEREELVECRPFDVEPVASRVALLFLTGEADERGGRRTAVAGDLRRDALRYLPERARLDEPEFVGMSVDVDESGSKRATGARDSFHGVPQRAITDQSDPPLDDCDIGHERGPASAIVDPGRFENRVDQGV